MKFSSTTVAVVTGANRARGIGFALVQELLARGCGKVLGSYRLAKNSKALLDLARLDPRVKAYQLDLTDKTGIHAFGAFCLQTYDHIDLLINNSGPGGTRGRSIMKAPIEDYEEELQMHAVGPLRLAQLLWPLLKKSKLPVIVNVSSSAGRMSSIGAGNLFYGPAKAAQNAISIQMAAGLGDQAIVIPMHPGWVATDMGGSSAPVSPQESARGILDYLAKARSNDSGRFVDFRGKGLPWD